jgi:hypothetical protein
MARGLRWTLLASLCTLVACDCGGQVVGATDGGDGGFTNPIVDGGAPHPDGGQDGNDGGDDLRCRPKTCETLDAQCGPHGDGCGGLIDCGTCAAPQSCGGGGVPNVCGGHTALADGGIGCTPRTCAELGFNCGPAGDGCGGLLQCGDCTSPQLCGGGGQAGVCGGQGCVPRSCADLGATCGVQGDGCGGLTVDCGSCAQPEVCGGGGVANACGSTLACVNLCLQQNACTGQPRTSVTGTVLAPTDPSAGYGQPDPLPGAFVYVPNGTVLPFPAGAACEKCADTVTGDPLVHTTSDVDGTFTLQNVPCGQDIPVVIQLGRWRRQIILPNVPCCQNTALTSEQTRLPRRQAEGHPNDNIPLIAVVTGSVDKIECVLPKIGIAPDQYTQPSGNGRVRFYRDNGAQGPGGNTPTANTLYGSPSELQKYDMVVIDCVGSEVNRTVTHRSNLEQYANTGGRLFLSHFAYVWLYPTTTSGTQPNSFSPTATWQPRQTNPPNQDAFIDTSFPGGQTFAQWVYMVGAQAASSTLQTPRIRVNTVRRDMNAIHPPAERWVWGTPNGTGTSPEVPLQYTFNTPVAAAPENQCGRVLFSDFHVINASNTGSLTWPSQCDAASPMTPQEKVFQYLLFNLTSCVTPYVATCTPKTCAEQGFSCGPASDGCGNVLQCGHCPSPQTCGGGGQPNVCGPVCAPRTCADLGMNCGPAGDGCGGTLECGTCTPPQFCGGGGPGICGNHSCTPYTCEEANYECGPLGDGCGNLLDCGSCPPGSVCGGTGVHGKCSPLIN